MEDKKEDTRESVGTIGNQIFELGTKIKQYEKSAESLAILDPTKYTVLRVDGHGFSKFTRPFIKPCDSIVSDAMIRSTGDWLKLMGGVTAYTQSDESTLLIPPSKIDTETQQPRVMMYSGRTTKLCTLSAGFFSARFNFYLTEQLDSILKNDKRRVNIKSGMAYFDCRVFQCDPCDVVDIFLWRRLDAFRNGVHAIARTRFSSKQLLHCNIEKQLEMIRQVDPILITAFPHLTYGTWVKKKLVQKESVDQQTNLPVTVMRTELVFVNKLLDSSSEFEIPQQGVFSTYHDT